MNILFTLPSSSNVSPSTRTLVLGSEADKPSETDLSGDTRRAGLEAALRLGSEPFRLLVDSVKDYGIFMLNPAGHVATWNDGARRIKGYAAEEILGRHFSAFYPPEDKARGKPAYELKVAATDGRFEDEGWRVRKDGSMFWANVVITALRDERGTLLGFAKVTRDLTERRAGEDRAIAHASALAAEEAARRVAEDRAKELASLLDQVQTQAMELETQTEEAQAAAEELEQANDELQRTNVALQTSRNHAEQLFALASGLADARTVDDVADVVLRKGMAAVGADAAALAILNEPPHEGGQSEFSILRSTGYPEAVRSRFLRFPVQAGRPLSDAVLSRRPVLLESLEEWHARYPDMAVQTTEMAFEGMANIPVMEHGQPLAGITFSFRGPRKFDRETQTFLATLGEQCGLAFGRAQAFEAERDARAAAEEANRAKMDFLATMSHELRTPLNAITGYTQLLEIGARGPVTEDQRLDLGRIRASGRHLLGLINDVLNYAKLDAGKVEFAVTTLSLLPIIDGVVTLMTPQATERGLSLSIESDAAAQSSQSRDPTVRADEEKLRQILFNLVSNAIKYTRAGGAVTLAAAEDGQTSTVRVRDTGIGIPKDKLERVFEPFIQLGRSLSSKAEGMGLGLAISRELARAMGGDLSVESQEGAGSTFTLALPRD